jgi:AcrR family transcriptional regulator
MPKIAAATVAEHRAQVLERLVNAAERILQSGTGQLTAGAVTAEAGIARNSVYRYVDSIEDLRTLVVARHLPAWLSAVDSAMARAHAPLDRVLAWVHANLDEASGNNHAWLMDAVRTAPRPAVKGVDAAASADAAHADLRGSLLAAWLELFDGDQARGRLATAVTFGLVETGFRRLEAGDDPALVHELCAAAARGVAVTPRNAGGRS